MSDFVLLWVLFMCMHLVDLFFVVVLFSNCFLKKRRQESIGLGGWGGREVLGDEGGNCGQNILYEKLYFQ